MSNNSCCSVTLCMYLVHCSLHTVFSIDVSTTLPCNSVSTVLAIDVFDVHNAKFPRRSARVVKWGAPTVFSRATILYYYKLAPPFILTTRHAPLFLRYFLLPSILYQKSIFKKSTTSPFSAFYMEACSTGLFKRDVFSTILLPVFIPVQSAVFYFDMLRVFVKVPTPIFALDVEMRECSTMDEVLLCDNLNIKKGIRGNVSISLTSPFASGIHWGRRTSGISLYSKTLGEN